MITIELTINNKTYKATKTGNLYHYTFTPTQPNQTIHIHHLGCFGDTEVRQIQLEQGDKPTYFVEPSWFESELSGLFKDMRAIKVEIRDEESDLWSRISANAKGLLIEYQNNEFSHSIAHVAGQLKASIEDEGRELSSTLMHIVNGLDVKVDNLSVNISSRLTILSNAIHSKIAEVDSKLSSRITQTINGFNIQVEDLSRDMNSQFSILSGQINAKVSREDVQSIIGQSGDAIWLMVKDRVPDRKMTGEEIKSAINLTRDGVRIQGKNIMLDGNSYISSGVIKNAHIGSLDASKITTGKLNSAIVNAIRLNVANLTGDISNFIQSHWNGINSRISINGNELTARHADGSYTVLNASGLYTRIGSSNYQTHYLHDIFYIPKVCNDTQGGWRAGEIGLNTEPYYWYTLPSVYRGKKFKVLASLSDTLTFNSPNYTNGNMRLLRTVCYVQQDMIDYENARVPIVGYAHVRNIGYGYNYNYPVSVNLFVNY